MFGGIFEDTETKKLVRELQDKVSSLEEKFSSINFTASEQKNYICELQNKVTELENKNLPIKPVCNETKIVGAKSSDQKLFVIRNNIETKMSVEEIFSDNNFTDLKIVTYKISPDFFNDIVKNFQTATLIIGDKKFDKNFDAELLHNPNIKIKITKNELIHDKIFLLSNSEKNLYRVVTGSANFTNAAFEKNFETIRVDDSKELYNLYLQRFDFLFQQQIDDFDFNDKQLSKNIKHNIGDYLENFKTDIENRKKFANRKSGFKFFDDQQVIYPGLYVIGGVPSVGKTTFVWQLLNQMAQNGETCIYFSYETSALDLILKSMAQENFEYYDKKDGYGFLTAEYIRENLEDQNVQNSIYGIKKKKLGLQIFELSDETVDDLLECLQKICEKLDKPPIIAIDYLQIIPSGKGGIKSAIDDTVRKLKNFQRETNSTFFIISSFNRENYKQVDFKSFKESGGIEYTADVVLGLSKLKLTKKTVRDFNLAKDKEIEVRQIKLKCIKNRQGKTYDVYFEYYPENDFFKSVGKFPKDEKKTSEDETLNYIE